MYVHATQSSQDTIIYTKCYNEFSQSSAKSKRAIHKHVRIERGGGSCQYVHHTGYSCTNATNYTKVPLFFNFIFILQFTNQGRKLKEIFGE